MRHSTPSWARCVAIAGVDSRRIVRAVGMRWRHAHACALCRYLRADRSPATAAAGRCWGLQAAQPTPRGRSAAPNRPPRPCVPVTARCFATLSTACGPWLSDACRVGRAYLRADCPAFLGGQQAAQDQLVPLMSEAAFKGDVATMERLVAKGATVNQHDQVNTHGRREAGPAGLCSGARAPQEIG
jgi:hypothetical protein